MEVQLKKLDKKIRTIWLWFGIIGMILLTGGLAALCIVCYNVNALIPMLIPSVILFLLFFFLLIIYPFLRYNCYSYGYDDKRIYINKGVIFRRRIIVPICQIQDLHLAQGPIMILCNLSEILISTAGSNHIIKGLNSELAKEMVDEFEANLQKRVEALKDE